jgi:hypothetical protein
LIIKQLDLAEAMIVQLVNTGRIDLEARLKEMREQSPEEAED